ncbi:Scr1 family TA system antitoxin-like transcriptional regulator [Kitasatospora purpeofusca]|uniref:Scr1 family TA system antitoxin-like transcriptional regulator n=1 Tax=Kitasatospora purpeofusca TaxID=67352 RepID=UPI0039B82679
MTPDSSPTAYKSRISVLRYPVCGADTMAAQLGHLLEVMDLPDVALGIVPFTAQAESDRSLRAGLRPALPGGGAGGGGALARGGRLELSGRTVREGSLGARRLPGGSPGPRSGAFSRSWVIRRGCRGGGRGGGCRG